MDVSDGLAQDLAHLCLASNLAAVLRSDDVPLSAPARALLDAGEARLEDILGGGDDYELLFTAPKPDRAKISERAKKAGVSVTRIGETSLGHGITIRDRERRVVPLDRLGYRHG